MAQPKTLPELKATLAYVQGQNEELLQTRPELKDTLAYVQGQSTDTPLAKNEFFQSGKTDIPQPRSNPAPKF